MMITEYRPETCSDCGADREREWMVHTVPKGLDVSKGWHVESRNGAYKVIAFKTRWTTICECDAP